MIIDLTKDSFDEIVTAKDCTIIDFWAQWCGPCRHFGEVFAEVAKKHPDIAFAKVNIEEETELADDFNIKSVPHVAVCLKNVVVYSQSGSLLATELEQLIAESKNCLPN